MKKKKISSLILAVTVTAMMLTGCGNGNKPAGTTDSKTEPSVSDEATTPSTTTASGEEVSITLLNTKSELVEQFDRMAEEYKTLTGVNVEIAFTSDVVSTFLAQKYASGDAYTIMMVDRPDVYDFQEYLLDLSNEKWIQDGGSTYGVAVDGKVYGFPMLIESVGLLYNAQAIETVTGKEFKWEEYNTAEKFQALLDELVKGGMKTPVAINKDDWSLANHFFGQLYNQQGNSEEGSQKFVDSLKDGSMKLAENNRFQSLMDSFDLLAGYNINGADPLSADYDMNNTYFAEGEVAFWYNGSWANDVYGTTDKIGMMPLPQSDTEGEVNDRLISGSSKTLVVDAKYSSEQQQQAAKDFLNWLVYEEAGQSFMIDDCSIVPAFSNVEKAVSAPLSMSAQGFIQNNATEYWYQTIPGDHGTEVGASLQKYLSGKTDREQLAAEVEAYWQKQK